MDGKMEWTAIGYFGHTTCIIKVKVQTNTKDSEIFQLSAVIYYLFGHSRLTLVP